MTSFAATSRRFLQRLVGRDRRPAARESGSAAVLDGLTAVAITEAIGSECAAFDAGAGHAFRDHLRHHHVNCLGEPFSGVETAGPRGTLEAALGLALSGQRASALLTGPGLVATGDLLPVVAGRHIPLVLHLACRAPAAHAAAAGTGHEAYHAAGTAGLLQLFAINVQEAVDLALIARQVTERTLVPALVAMDGEQTAHAAQDVLLPEATMVKTFLGDPAEHMPSPTEAQRALFGDVRRLVPRWFDGDRPLMLGSHQGPESWGLGAAAMRPHFTDVVPDRLTQAFERFAELSGRRYGPLLEHRVRDATIVLVAQGAAVETAVAVAEHARRHEHLKVGVVGVRCLRPLPGVLLAGCLLGKKAVAVLERVDTPLAHDGPLLRELRAVLDRASENARFGEATHPGYPPLRGRDRPRLVGVPYGLGGFPVRAADLLSLARELHGPRRSRLYLGMEFAPAASAYPKRQARMDELRRGTPLLAALGGRSTDAAPDVRPPGAVTIAIHRLPGGPFDELAGEAASMMQELAGGRIRSRPGLAGHRVDEPCIDVVTWAEPPLADPGDDVAVDVAVCALPRFPADSDPTRRLVPGGVVLVAPPSRDEPLPAALRTAMHAGHAEVYAVQPPGDAAPGDRPAERAFEVLLAAVLACFASRSPGSSVPIATLRSAREDALGGLADADRARRVEAFVSAYEAASRAQPLDAGPPTPPEPAEPDVPPLIRRLDRADQTLDCIAHFWDQVGVLYRANGTDELYADPYLATGSMPPLTASLGAVPGGPGGPGVLPVFDPGTCDGTGRLWTTCPDGSVAPLVLTPRALIEAGIGLASERGRPADALRSVVAKLAKRATRIMAERERPPITAAALLREAFADACGTMDAPRRVSLEDALTAVAGEIGDLPIARTKVFFDAAEEAAPGTGALFSLAIDPDACRCPQLLLAECAGHGLAVGERTPASLAAARRLWDLRERLPEPAPETIERARNHPDVGPLAAIMLSRRAPLSMPGAANAGQRLALSRALAVAEHAMSGRHTARLAEIDDLRGRLGARIRDLLSEALPGGDLDALAEGLDALGRTDMDLSALSQRLDQAVDHGRVDGLRLGRLVEVARGLADLYWRQSVGRDGFGRAKISVIITGAASEWTSVYPDNPFIVPVAVGTVGEGTEFARGLGEGSRRQTVAAARLLRWARLELEHPAEAPHAVASLAHLRFEDLTAAERAHCPPVLLVGDGPALSGAAGCAFVGGDHPVKVLVIDGWDAGAGDAAGRASDLVMPALVDGRAFVVQASLAHADHFALGVERAMAFDGPALIHVHVPDAGREGFPVARLFTEAQRAVASRVSPLLIFDPSGGEVLGAALDLSGNPSAGSTWFRAGNGVALTPVDAALNARGRDAACPPIAPDDPAPTPVDEYLLLAPHDRRQRTPFIVRGEGDGARRLRVRGSLISAADDFVRRWRMLQEIAGIVTPFSEAIRAETTRQGTQEHEAEIARLTRRHEERIARLRAEFEEEAAERIAGGLLALADSAAREDGAS